MATCWLDLQMAPLTMVRRSAPWPALTRIGHRIAWCSC